MYQALYRKWRPQTFDDVIGQKQVTNTLKNQVKTGRLSHAYIFIGTRGTGKTTCARILAKAVNCEHPVDGNPCGVCPACRGIADGSIMDIVEIDAASNNGVDNVRSLRDEAVFSPSTVKKRVYIIDEVHMMSTAAFNALLKILEEPPEHLMFILATTELRKVPATILSRCQRHNFKRIDSPVIADYLLHVAQTENINLTEDAAGLIARLAEGGMRDALSLLDQCSAFETIDPDAVYSAMGLAGAQKTIRLLRSIIRRNSAEAITSFQEMWVDGKDPVSVLDELRGLMRDILMLQVAPQAAPKLVSGMCEMSVLNEFAQSLTTEELLAAVNTIQTAMDSMKGAKTPKTAAEICIISLCENMAGDSIANLRARVSQLEKQLESGSFTRTAPSDQAFYQAPVTIQPQSQAPPTLHAGTPAPSFKGSLSATPDPQPQPTQAGLDRAEPEIGPDSDVSEAEVNLNTLTAENDRSAESAADGRDELIAEFTDAVKQIDPGVRTTFNDGTHTRVIFRNGGFTIYADPGFTLNRLKLKSASIADAAKKVIGREVTVKIEEMTAAQQKVRSLDELRAFPEVKFVNDK